MAINFPDYPNPGDFHTVDQTTWTWDGTIWAIVPTSYAPNDLLPLQTGQTGKFLSTDGTNGLWSPIPPGGASLIGTTAFTATTTVSVNNVFSSTYKDYQIRISEFSHSYIGKVYFRLRVSGADNSDALYSRTNSYIGTTTSVNQNSSSAGIIFGNRYYYGSPGYSMNDGISITTIANPFETIQTSWIGSSYVRQQNYSGNDMSVFGGNHDSATSYTGFTIFHESGQVMSGRVSVYGLAT